MNCNFKNNENSEKWISIREAERQTRYSKKQIQKLVEHGKIKWQKDKGHILVDVIDVIKYQTAHPATIDDVVWDRILSNQDPYCKESFFPITGYDDKYASSSRGRIVNFTSGEVLSDKPRPDGYITVALQKDGKTKMEYAQRLVAMTQLPNARAQIYPNSIWEVHHIHIGLQFRCNNAPEELLWVLKSEHVALHKLWDTGKKKEYWQMVRQIKKANSMVLFKIPNTDYGKSETYNYWFLVNKKGKKAYDKGQDLPWDCIYAEYAECKTDVEDRAHHIC